MTETKQDTDGASTQHEAWYAEACTMTLDKLQEFLRMMLATRPDSKLGIYHAFVAGALATIVAMATANAQPLTAQASDRVMFIFITRWKGIVGPIKLLRFESMLYPALKSSFDSVISPEIWGYLQSRAQRLLLDPKQRSRTWREHWTRIVTGEIPFGWKLEE